MASVRANAIERIMARKGLGRRPATDIRDHKHTMRAVLPPATEIDPNTSKIWRGGIVLDQGNTPQCVAYAWTGFLLAAPMMDRASTLGSGFEQKLYDRAQQLDEWPGESYEGTSTRAGAKAITELGRLKEYVWAWDEPTLRRFVQTRGPVVLGIDWTEEMFLPVKGYLDISGPVAGGHDILCIGWSRSADAYRLIQSWGKSWGQAGRTWLRTQDMVTLFNRGGEACSGIEQRVLT